MSGPFNITPAAVLSDLSVAGTIGTHSILQKIDVVAVLNQRTRMQAFHDARPVKAEVRETAKVMDYPVETGVTLSDHRISLPTEIVLVCIIPQKFYNSAYNEIRNSWINATLLSVQTRLGTYKNMIISELPHDEDPDMFTAVTIFIKMREVIFIAPSSIAPGGQLANFSPSNPADQPTVNSGLLAAVNATSGALSYLHAATVFGGHL